MFGTLISTSKINSLFSIGLLSFVGFVANAAQAKPSAPKIYAQRLVEETLAMHPEITGLEIATTPPTKSQCITIASNESKGIGEKCDKDEFTAMKTNKPFVEKEMENGKEVYDVTVPIHDVDGKIIGTAGIDFKPDPKQSDPQVTEHSQRIAKELESKVKSKEKLFEPVA